METGFRSLYLLSQRPFDTRFRRALD